MNIKCRKVAKIIYYKLELSIAALDEGESNRSDEHADKIKKESESPLSVFDPFFDV